MAEKFRTAHSHRCVSNNTITDDTTVREFKPAQTRSYETEPTDVGRLSLESLEQRIDNLEDHSRRDNLLFYGFPEDRNENCAEKVKQFIFDKRKACHNST